MTTTWHEMQPTTDRERFPDGSAVWRTERGKWIGKWADGTMMMGCDPDSDQCQETTSYFDSKEEAVEALVAGGEGPQTQCVPQAAVEWIG